MRAFVLELGQQSKLAFTLTVPRLVHAHTKEKLRILAQYLPVYLQVTKNALDRIYVDAFAGPGLNRIKDTGEDLPGSPLIAAEAVAQTGTRSSRLVFIEQNRETFGELAEALARRGADPRIEL